MKTLMKVNFSVILFALGVVSKVAAQTHSPVVVNATGGSATLVSTTYEWSIGEMTLVESMIKTDLSLTNGFLQPQKLAPVPADAFNIKPNNILSPNGDGENDTWTIEHLQDFPDNEVIIYDRGGRIVYQAKNYQNNWTGKVDNLLLAEDSYLYIIKLKKGELVGIKKGFLTIVR